jgi:flagellar motor switch protein FliG
MNLKDRLNQAYGAPSGATRNPPDAPPEAAGKSAERIRKTDASPPAPKAAVPAEGLIKKTGLDRGYRKVAKFLLLLGQEEAARVMQHLKREELEGIVKEISSIKQIETVEAEAILAEFGDLIKTGAYVSSGGVETARDILVQAFGEEKGHELYKRAVPGSLKPFHYLQEYDSSQILILLKDESANVLAIVLPHLDPKKASEVILRLPEGQRTEVVSRMAKLDKVRPDVIASIDEGLRKSVEKLGKVDTENVDGAKALAGILRFVDPDREAEILEALEEMDPELSRSIRDKLFTLDDVLRVRPLDLQRELRDMADKDIAMVLKGKGDEFREKILSCVSRERRKVISDEYEYLGSVRRQDADAQSRDFLMKLKRRYEDGELSLEDDEDLVV